LSKSFTIRRKDAWGKDPGMELCPRLKGTEAEYDRLNALYSPESKFMLDPTKGKKHLWGTTPPLDILNIPANEGANYDKPLLLNFRVDSRVILCSVHKC
jgi:hypothetical protein